MSDVDAGLKKLKVIGRGENCGWKRVQFSRDHRDKGCSERVGLIVIQI